LVKIFEVITRGVATGVYIGIYTPKSTQVNFLWGKNDVRDKHKQAEYGERKIKVGRCLVCLEQWRLDSQLPLLW